MLAAPVAVAEVAHLGEDLALPVDAVAHLPPASLADFPVQVEQVQPLPVQDCIWEVVIIDLCMLALLHRDMPCSDLSCSTTNPFDSKPPYRKKVDTDMHIVHHSVWDNAQPEEKLKCSTWRRE